MNRYVKKTIQAVLFYIGAMGLLFGMVIAIGCVAGVIDKMLSSSLQVWFDIFVMLNIFFFAGISITYVIFGFLSLWKKVSKIPEG